MTTLQRTLARAPSSYDALTPAQRRALVGAIVAVHVAGLWALMQVREVRDAVAQVAPVFATWIAPDRSPEPVPPPPAPVPERLVTPQRIVAAAPSPAPAPFVAAAPPDVVEPALPAAVIAAPAEPAPTPPAPASAPAQKIIPASEVQYLEPLSPEYPRLAKRMGESGRVVVRVFIDAGGLARDARVDRSSGHPRLDEAATAAVQKARFKPYTENGHAVAGWAFIPIEFELEK
jgi:periplasmic protein TonB